MRLAILSHSNAKWIGAAILGLVIGCAVPAKVGAYEVWNHGNHRCETITCGNVQTQNCVNNGWCLDTVSPLRFPKCMPRTAESCSESYGYGTGFCNDGRCIGTMVACTYTLRMCIAEVIVTDPVSVDPMP